jgi:hypothetical protein
MRDSSDKIRRVYLREKQQRNSEEKKTAKIDNRTQRTMETDTKWDKGIKVERGEDTKIQRIKNTEMQGSKKIRRKMERAWEINKQWSRGSEKVLAGMQVGT